MKRILNTLSQKWPEYLLEILVLIIGIYGAFAVENWNESRKEKEKEKIALTQLVVELRQDAEWLNQLKELSYKRKIGLQAIASNENSALDSLSFFINRYAQFKGVNSKYLGMKSSNELSIISNESLRNSITKYYEITYREMGDWIDYQKEYVSTQVEPFITEKIPLDQYERSDIEEVNRQLRGFHLNNLIFNQIIFYQKFGEITQTTWVENQALIKAIQIEQEL